MLNAIAYYFLLLYFHLRLLFASPSLAEFKATHFFGISEFDEKLGQRF
jgi:hypothetical protein